MNKTVIKNFFYAFGAQVVSLGLSIIMTFFTSSLIGVKEFAYWQLFLMYVSYVSITRLGINDGLYLRLGGRVYDELDYALLSRERRVFNSFQIVVASILTIIICYKVNDSDRKFVLLACAVCIVIVNMNGYLIYILQAVNKTRVYSISVILQNLMVFVSIIMIVFLKIYSYKIIIIMYILGHILAGFYLAYHTKEIIAKKYFPLKLVIEDIKENIACGIKLMISTYAGSFIIASCRMVIDMAWGVEIFGIFSFSLTLANVFLTFISQTSIIVFPALRRVPNAKIKSVYVTMKDALSLILPLVMLGYLPIIILINAFLPQYVESLLYLPIFLPICTFDGKMQMMCSSFFKALRKESVLLGINLITLFCSIIMALIGSYIVHDIMFVAIGILLVIAFRSIISELYLSRLMKESIIKEVLQEIMLVFGFVVGSMYLDPVKLFFGYSFIYLCYIMINKEKVRRILRLRREF